MLIKWLLPADQGNGRHGGETCCMGKSCRGGCKSSLALSEPHWEMMSFIRMTSEGFWLKKPLPIWKLQPLYFGGQTLPVVPRGTELPWGIPSARPIWYRHIQHGYPKAGTLFIKWLIQGQATPVHLSRTGQGYTGTRRPLKTSGANLLVCIRKASACAALGGKLMALHCWVYASEWHHAMYKL